MGLPAKLKHLNIFNEGRTHVGEAESFTLPKLTRKKEPFRGGGMAGAVKVDHGLVDDALQVEWPVGGYSRQVIQQMGNASASGVMLRFVCSLQRDDTGAVDAVEIVIRGRHNEIDRGEFKPGEDTTTKITTDATYYKETVNGVVDVEIDLINMVEIYGGVDRQAEHRRAIGV